MKCDELMKYGMDDPTIGDDYEMYRVADVDVAIAELKEVAKDACLERDDNQNAIDELQAENRRLKRALYKACANWARSERYTEATWHGDEHREELWANVQAKCLKKADEYK